MLGARAGQVSSYFLNNYLLVQLWLQAREKVLELPTVTPILFRKTGEVGN